MDIAKPMELTKNRSMELWNYYGIIKTGLIYNTSARHERHECGRNETRMRYEQQSVTQVRHECDTDDTTTKRVKNFDNNMSKNNFFKQTLQPLF